MDTLWACVNVCVRAGVFKKKGDMKHFSILGHPAEGEAWISGHNAYLHLPHNLCTKTLAKVTVGNGIEVGHGMCLPFYHITKSKSFNFLPLWLVSYYRDTTYVSKLEGYCLLKELHSFHLFAHISYQSAFWFSKEKCTAVTSYSSLVAKLSFQQISYIIQYFLHLSYF